MMLIEACAAVCINSFFMWPEQDWNLGEWVERFTGKVERQMVIQPYANYDQNITVVGKYETTDGCAAVMIEVRAVNPKLPTVTKTGTLNITKVCRYSVNE
jgi:hypothetical protein